MNALNEDELRFLATRRVQARMSLLQHVIVYAVVNAALILIWYATGHGYPWFIWPLIGWGIAIVFHAVDVAMKVRSPEREERAVAREMSRLRSARRTQRISG